MNAAGLAPRPSTPSSSSSSAVRPTKRSASLAARWSPKVARAMVCERTGMRDALLDWYAAHGRDLPWRRTRDPYAVLVSEVMLQQTQVARVVERWERWLARWPTAGALAQATPAEVLRE